MRHFVLAALATQRSPVGLGDAESWFRFYKLEALEQVSIPRLAGLEEAAAGDVLWLILGEHLYGYVRILRVERDEFNNRDELWFDTATVTVCPRGIAASEKTGSVSSEQAEIWLRTTRVP